LSKYVGLDDGVSTESCNDRVATALGTDLINQLDIMPKMLACHSLNALISSTY